MISHPLIAVVAVYASYLRSRESFIGVRAWFVACLVMPTLANVGAAQTVYRTTVDGTPTFSDVHPEDGRSEVIELHPPAPSADSTLAERLGELRETTDRMAADRREREQQRRADRELRLARANTQNTTGAVPGSESPLLTGYWPYAGWPQRRPNRWPSVTRPSGTGYLSPAPPPGWSVMRPVNSQLMRPIVSRRN